jgi:peptide chain release factor 1
MNERLQTLLQRYTELHGLIQDPALVKDQKKYRDTMREYAQLGDIAAAWQKIKDLGLQIADAKSMVQDEKDGELRELAREELRELEVQLKAAEDKLKFLLIPKDPLDEKNIIMEIRAGTGGDEAALFAADLYRMYARFAETRGWKFEIMSSNETGLGGFKEIIFSINGRNVYENFRYESGVHRVQRVPATEASGRIHTSAVTVAVLPEADETEIDIRPEDLRIDVMRAGGPGGQCVNTTDSAVRITHLPSGITVHCQDEKSQIKNKAKAMRILRARVYEMEEAKAQSERAEARKNQVGSGDRSERIRTYNFPQNRLTDHRINLTLYKLDLIMQGDVEELFDALKLSAREEMLRAKPDAARTEAAS